MASPFVPNQHNTPTLLHTTSSPSLLPTFRAVNTGVGGNGGAGGVGGASPFVMQSNNNNYNNNNNNSNNVTATNASVFVVSTTMLPDVPSLRAHDAVTNTLFGGSNSGRSTSGGGASAAAAAAASSSSSSSSGGSLNYAALPGERPTISYQALPEEEVIPGYGRVPRGLEQQQRLSTDVDSVRGYGNLPRSASVSSMLLSSSTSTAAAPSPFMQRTGATTTTAAVPSGFVVSTFQPSTAAATTSSSSSSTSTPSSSAAAAATSTSSPFVPRAISLQIDSDGGVKNSQYDKMKQIRNPYEFAPVAATPGYDKMRQVKNPYGELKSDDQLSQRTNYGALKDDDQLLFDEAVAAANDANNPYRSLQPLPDLTDDGTTRSPYDAMPTDLAMKLQMANNNNERTSEVSDVNNPYRRLRPLPEPTDDDLLMIEQAFGGAGAGGGEVNRRPTAEELQEESELVIIIPNPTEEAMRRQLPSPQSSPTITPPAGRGGSGVGGVGVSQPIAAGRRGGAAAARGGAGRARGSPTNEELQRRQV